ncbi:hypothetical protein [Maribacter hydrothermalis]|uniref:Uncharacterized protein n=1 Tax=Maribacter hydrothermalis TaxID=1836467 RepID=A0A1B7ZD12_9FLAO|nr:hypothetical protein [Maribacter hydrothermalis]APQ18716.1 hypothetical protein BTR34_15930 [Maribacter hydrothermalis]OBR40984.1 hypothetical protein A9200_14230 [Maribacter hydrothermalis]
MITDDKSTHKNNTSNALKNDVLQNQPVKQQKNPKKDIGKPVNNGGVATAKYDLHLEKQWLAVKDEYLANFPETENYDSTKEENSLEALISDIAKKRKKSPQEIHDEIMNWKQKR